MSRKIILIKQELLLLVYELNRSGLLAENEKIRPILRSEERFSRNAETDLVCRLLLEKKKNHSRLRSVPVQLWMQQRPCRPQGKSGETWQERRLECNSAK